MFQAEGHDSVLGLLAPKDTEGVNVATQRFNLIRDPSQATHLFWNNNSYAQ
jgi:hypothetical protein